jgi:hypothetical protein
VTTVSRAGLVLALGLAGCTTQFKLDPARTPDLVAPYSRSRQTAIYYQGTRYAIGPEQAPELRVTARRPSCQPARGALAPVAGTQGADAPVASSETFSAPLGDVRAEGGVLYFPNTRAVRTSEIQRAELRLPGAGLVPVPKSADEKSRPVSARYNFLGAQFGGSGIVQGVYRRRLYGPLFFDLGLLAVPAPVLHGSAGLVLELPTSSRWSIYTGGGGGFYAGLAGGGEGCPSGSENGDPEASDAAADSGDDCVTTSVGPTTYLYGRVGIAVRLGPQLRDQIGIDAGFWSGAERTVSSNGAVARHPFLWPMAGLFMIHAL